MDSFKITEMNKTLGQVFDAASRRAVALTESGKRKYVLMAAFHYDQLLHKSDPRPAYSTDKMPSDVQEMVLAALDQDPECQQAFKRDP